MQTPKDFLQAVEKRFGRLCFDLAATVQNSVAGPFAFYGPGSPNVVNGIGEDSLAKGCHWPRVDRCWLNPPFGNIRPWAEKCVSESAGGARIFLLVPASVGADWFTCLRENAYVLELAPRLTFVGHDGPYPKDLVLAYFGPERFIGRAFWRWA